MNAKRMMLVFVVVLVVGIMSTVATADIIAYWPLDEGVGDVFYDISGNSYNGTVGGENVEWTSGGYINNGLEFTFATEAPYPEAEAQFGAGVLNIGELTFALWVKMSKPFRSWGPLFVFLGEGHDWDFEPDDKGILWMAVFDEPPEGEVWWGGGDTLDDNRWHHVALTCSNSRNIAILYVDGQAVVDTSESFGGGSGWPFSDEILGIRLGGPRDRNQWASYGGFLDEVVVYNEPLDAGAINDLYLNGPRVHFKNRLPGYGEINVKTTAVLSWDAPGDYTPTGYDVYLGTDPNETAVPEYSSLGQTETTFDPDPDLEYETTYYWQLIVYEPNDGGTGGVPHVSGWWPFTTESLASYITLQPSSQVVDVGDTAVFTIASENTTNYTWKKVSDGSVVLSGAEAATFTITNVQLADEDFYYCELTNDIGTVVSDQARLMTRRLVGLWKLDGDGTDSVALEIPGAPTHDGILPDDPNFIVNGIDGGGAYAFFGDGRVIEVADSSEYFNFYPQGMTVSVWVKTSTTTWDGVVAKQYKPEEGTFLGWLIDVSDDWCHFTVRGSHDDLWGSDDDGTMFDGNWHLITGVMDPETETSRIYVDGVERDESVVYDMANALLTTEPVVFGAETVLGQIPYTGQIDDVRIWNYPLDTIDIALLYTQFNPDAEVCVDRDDPWMYFDVVGEPGESSYCRIDIEDFAELALVWMECNLVPTCLP